MKKILSLAVLASILIMAGSVLFAKDIDVKYGSDYIAPSCTIENGLMDKCDLKNEQTDVSKGWPVTIKTEIYYNTSITDGPPDNTVYHIKNIMSYIFVPTIAVLALFLIIRSRSKQ